ncbi:hypothetical protein ACIA8O_28770 [Kitasatospora sp. NPDC051853]|uniref:hypothetical protein n=1 Tax=Kitasatospora sp. NPDC051853 TaxID=3364058 RepID=UPI0037B2CC32
MTAEPVRRGRAARGLFALAVLLLVAGALGLLAGGVDGLPGVLRTLNQPLAALLASAAAFAAALVLSGAKAGRWVRGRK